MQYYSHVLYFPNSSLFDNDDFRWTTFVGEFVRPIVENISDLYWFSYYTTYARFRIYTNQYHIIKPRLESLRDSLGLIDKGEEKDLTLESDLGSDRYLSKERTDKTQTDRALLVLKLLNSGCKLFIDTLIKDGHYWKEELNNEINNPLGSSSYSYIHLLHNFCNSDVKVYLYQQNGNVDVLSYYYFREARRQGSITPQNVSEYNIPI